MDIRTDKNAETEDNRNVHRQKNNVLDRQTDREMEAQKGQTDGQTEDIQRDRRMEAEKEETDGETDGQNGRQIDGHTDADKYRDRR
jgi:hypothetical protein